MLKVKLSSELTLYEVYDVFSDYELVIRDQTDDYMIWCGNFEDMPVKYGCCVVKELNMDENEIEVLV